MDLKRRFTLNVLRIVRDNPNYVNRMREAQKQVAVLVADRVPDVPEYIYYAYNYFKERA